ncbi:MAG: 23S rRNA pseudouridine(1911/1915/1917) synthase RluD [Candidatus Thiodiazotropha sp.]
MSDSNTLEEVPLRTLQVAETQAGQRVDQVLSAGFPEYSRSRLQQWIKQGRVLLQGQACRPKDRVKGGESLSLQPLAEPCGEDRPERMDLDLVYEDESLIVVNKPAGLVVHPAAGNLTGTLLNGLLAHAPELQAIPRAGIVHRLDKDTSGLLVVARTLEAHSSLVRQLQARSVKREYRAIAQGVLISGGTVDEPIGRHPVNRLRMAVVPQGKPAITHYRVLQRFRAHTDLQVRLETGRTHQIRVHMSHIHHPLLGDPLYGGRLKLPQGAGNELQQTLQNFNRQALHAARLGLLHPLSGEMLSWEAPLPRDMQDLLEILSRDAAHAS